MCASVRQAVHLHAVRRYVTLRPTKQKSAFCRRFSFLFTDDPQVFPQESCVYVARILIKKAKKRLAKASSSPFASQAGSLIEKLRFGGRWLWGGS
jgi:hypothetical protein